MPEELLIKIAKRHGYNWQLIGSRNKVNEIYGWTHTIEGKTFQATTMPNWLENDNDALQLVDEMAEKGVGFSYYNTQHIDGPLKGQIDHEIIFYDPWGGPKCYQYKAVSTSRARAICEAYEKCMEAKTGS